MTNNLRSGVPKGYYTRHEVAQHASEYDYWLVMGDKIYSFQNFRHPGGWLVHKPFAGGRLDATDVFNIKHGSDARVMQSLNNYFIGYIVEKPFNLSDMTFQERWAQHGQGWPVNIIGYGEKNPWIPPLKNPSTLLAAIDRHEMIRWTGGIITWFFAVTLVEQFFNFGNGDIWDGYWYNNNKAVGMQLYPKGIHKYFDMFSWAGLWDFTVESMWVFLWDCLMPFTLFIPVDIWIAMFEKSWDGMDKWLWWYFPWALGLNTIFAMLYDIPIERGFGILWN